MNRGLVFDGGHTATPGRAFDQAREFASAAELDEALISAEYAVGASHGDPSDLLEALQEQEDWE